MIYLTGFRQSINDVRAKYLVALHDCQFAEETYEYFLSIPEPSASIIAYKGALEAILTKTTWNPFKKFAYLKESKISFSKAVEMDPNLLEIRFLRMAVQYEIPSYLGFSDELKVDLAFILENYIKFNPKKYSAEVLNEIIGFVDKCQYFSGEETKRIKNILTKTD